MNTGEGRRLPLLTSKLAVPPSPSASVQRPRLLRLLDSGADGPVTVVSGPAGWGKTTLVSSWFRARDGAPRGWVSLDGGDSGERFWSYVCAALESTVSGLGDGHFPGPDSAFLVHLADALANRPEPVTLILDDFHQLADADAVTGLDFLLRHAGERLRLVIATRSDQPLPLHRWRLTDELTEVRAADLAFTPDEAADLLTGHGVTLPAGLVEDLQRRTEGWPAGLRLAALCLQGHAEPASIIEEFTGAHRAVADYLDQEVLAGLPADLRDALRRISLAERVSGGLVEALTGRVDGDAILDDLARGTGLVHPIGSRASAYRLHRMLGERLRAEFRRDAPEEYLTVHRRCAAWHAAHDLPADALRHALAARDWGYATNVLVDNWHELVPPTGGPAPGQPAAAQNGGRDVVAAPAAPPPPDAVRAEPELALAYAADRLDLRDLEMAENFLQLAGEHEHLLADERRDRFTLMTAALHLAEAQLGGDTGDVLAAASQLLALVEPADPRAGPPADIGARAVARAALGAAQLSAGDLASAEAALTGGLSDAEAAALSRATLVCASRLAFVRAVRGELRAAERTAHAALALPQCRAPSCLADCAYAYLALAVVTIERDQLGDAEANLTLAARSAEQPAEAPLAALVAVVRAQLLQDRGELTGSYQALRGGRSHLADGARARYLTHWAAAVEADLRTAHGDVDTARSLLLPLLEEDAGPVSRLAVALARADLRDGDPRSAARILPEWEDGVGRGAVLSVRLDAGLLDALTARQLGDHRRATRTLERVLQLAEPEGFRRVFIRQGREARDLLTTHLDSGTAYWPLVNELVAAIGTGRAPEGLPAPVVSEPLTDRELTVLRYLQSILSNVEIAAELSLSVNTVKTHVRNIYRKLDATRRREAVRRARELRLL